jgi:hypothetical protein
VYQAFASFIFHYSNDDLCSAQILMIFAVQKIGYFSADTLSATSHAASNDIEKFYNLGIYLYKLHKPVKLESENRIINILPYTYTVSLQAAHFQNKKPKNTFYSASSLWAVSIY